MKTKTFDAAAESRRWKEAVARQTTGMSRAELLDFFNKPCIADVQTHDPVDETSVLREEPPKP